MLALGCAAPRRGHTAVASAAPAKNVRRFMSPPRGRAVYATLRRATLRRFQRKRHQLFVVIVLADLDHTRLHSDRLEAARSVQRAGCSVADRHVEPDLVDVGPRANAIERGAEKLPPEPFAALLGNDIHPP